jgi:histone-lysine N-methyltransferase SETMAR
VQKFEGKFLASVFWDQDGILLIDYLQKDQTINAEYYLSLLVQLKDTLKEKRRGKVTKGVLFLHDSASAHGALASQKTLGYLDFQCLDHPHYSPDLATSDLQPVPWTCEGGRGGGGRSRHFSSYADVIAVETWLDGQHSELFLSGLQKLEQRAKSWIELRMECVE